MTSVAEILALLDKHTPCDASAKIGLSAARVRELMSAERRAKIRIRKRTTDRAKRYGWLKVAAANIPADGVVVANYRQANNLQVAAKRMGITLVTRRLGDGPARIVLPALTGAELSMMSAQL